MAPADETAAPRHPGPSAPSWLGRPRTWALAWLGWFITLCILSSMSQPGPRIDVVGIDKVYHAVFFAVGGTLLLLAFILRGNSAGAARTETHWGKLALGVGLAGAAVGGLDEWHQSFTPGRFGLDFYDWVADVAGSLAAVPIARLILGIITPRRTDRA